MAWVLYMAKSEKMIMVFHVSLEWKLADMTRDDIFLSLYETAQTCN